MPAMCRTSRGCFASGTSALRWSSRRTMIGRWKGQEVGRNPGLIKGQQVASANGAVLMAPSFSEEEFEAGFSDWNDLATHDEVRKGLVAKEPEQALQKAFALQDVHQFSVPGAGEDHGDAFDREHEARANDQNI